jgi:hypothetical protein
MLFHASSSDVYNQLGSVSSLVFGDLWPYLVIILGIIFAFYIIEVLIDLMPKSTYEKEIEQADREIARSEKLQAETEDLLKR